MSENKKFIRSSSRIKVNTYMGLSQNYLLDKVNVVAGPMYELGPSARESQELTAHFNPVLMPFHLSQLRVWYIMVPYLQDHRKTKLQSRKKIITIRWVYSILTLSRLWGHGMDLLYPSGSGTKHVGASSGQCLSRCSKCLVLCNFFNAFSLSKHGM